MKKWLATLGTALAVGLSASAYSQTDTRADFTKKAIAECFSGSKWTSPLERIDNESACIGLATEYVLEKTNALNHNQMLLLRSSFLVWLAQVKDNTTKSDDSKLFSEARDYVVREFWKEDYTFQVELINAYIAWYKAKPTK